LEGGPQLIRRDKPGRGEIAVNIRVGCPRLVFRAGVFVDIDAQDLALDDFAGLEAGTGDGDGRAWRIIGLIGRHGGIGCLGERANSAEENERQSH
jgi:hypothetical protein